ncbi:hypothetical protein K9U39_20490 [Rhodoblastus acidophilus]|nr:hypothetical protein [Rhodoblastus acidophilus]
MSDGFDLGDGQRHDCRGRWPQPGCPDDRVARDGFVPQGQPQREVEHDLGVLRSAVADLGLCFQEAIDLADRHLSKRVVLEGRQHQGTHVALVQLAGAGRDAVLELDVFEPHLDELGEGRVG